MADPAPRAAEVRARVPVLRLALVVRGLGVREARRDVAEEHARLGQGRRRSRIELRERVRAHGVLLEDADPARDERRYGDRTALGAQAEHPAVLATVRRR